MSTFPSTPEGLEIGLMDLNPAQFYGQRLMDELEENFPLRSPKLTDSLEHLMWLGGQREVVDYIRSRIMSTE